MPRKATGQVLHNATGYSARVRVAPGDEGRPCFALSVRDDAEAEKRTQILAEMAKRLRPVVGAEEIVEVLTDAGKARTAKELDEVEEIVRAIEAGETRKASSAVTPTFEDFAKTWTSGDLRKKHPDHVRDKDSTRDVQVLRDYINPVIGPMRIPDVTLENAERVMAKLPAELAPRTRKLVAQCMRKVLSLAVYPGRYITGNPIPGEWMPKIPKSANKAKSFLYPEEDAKLLGCAAVPLERRLAYGVLSREGMRASELASLRWRDLDLKHGRVRLDENKTDDPRAWALSPDVVRALAWWKKRTKGEADNLVLSFDLANGAWWLRGDEGWTKEDKTKGPGDLRTAGVTRRELFERSSARQPIRLHDLRATFVTVSLANGKTEQWVSDRTGHKSSQMIATYARQAGTWSELDLGTLGPLDGLLPEMKGATSSGAGKPPGSPGGGRGRRGASPARPRRQGSGRAAARSADWAANGQRVEVRTGFEPAYDGFANRCLTAWLPHRFACDFRGLLLSRTPTR